MARREAEGIVEKAKWSKRGQKRGREAEAEPPRKIAKIEGKIKTRGTPDPSRAGPSTPAPTPPASQPQEQHVQFSVPAKYMKVWPIMFSHKLKGGGRPGKLNWKDFLRAMHNIGFSARRDLGSNWNLTLPPALRHLGNICFHQPHPGPSQPAAIAKAMGDHLNDRYPGIDFNSFQEV